MFRKQMKDAFSSRKGVWLLVLTIPLFLLGLASQSNVDRFDFKNDGCSVGDETAGGGVPSPFSVSSIRVELADQEIYTLIGVVKVESEVPLLEVDLFEHPWLATPRRLENSKYPLIANSVVPNWKSLTGQRVRVSARAHFRMSSAPRFEIDLEALASPVAEPVWQSERLRQQCSRLEQ